MNDMTAEQCELVERNHNLIYAFLHQKGFSIDEYYGLAAIGLCRAVQPFDSTKSSFSTYAYKCMHNEILQEVRKEQASKRVPDTAMVYYQSEVRNDDGNTTTILDFIEGDASAEDAALCNVMCSSILHSLNEREKTAFTLLSKGYTQWEVASALDCTQASISRTIKRWGRQFNGNDA